MSKYYCHKTFSSGLTCSGRTIDGMCGAGIFVSCEYKKPTPKISKQPSPTFVPPPSVKQAKRKSTDCSWCKHKDVCSLKNRFKKLKSENYPMICECQYYDNYNPLLEV